jgi:hypothetical protein
MRIELRRALLILNRSIATHDPIDEQRQPFRGDDMTAEEIAIEFAEIFDELPPEQINEMLAKNVPFETIKFFSQYADSFGENAGIDGEPRSRLPNLMLFGYLIRVLEDRLLPDDPALDS